MVHPGNNIPALSRIFLKLLIIPDIIPKTAKNAFIKSLKWTNITIKIHLHGHPTIDSYIIDCCCFCTFLLYYPIGSCMQKISLFGAGTCS